MPERDLADLHDVAVVGQGQRRLCVLFDEQDRHALGLELDDRLHDLLHHDRGEPHRRLVEHQQLGLGHQRAPHGEHLLFAAGEGARRLLPSFSQDGEEVVGALDVLLDALLVVPEERSELEILEDREAREDVPALGGVGHPQRDDLVSGDAAQRFSVEGDGAAGGFDQP